MFNREIAEKYVEDNVKNINLRKHMYAVEACVKAYAIAIKEGSVKVNNTLNEDISKIDPEEWALAGLMHDGDWESFPDKHPVMVVKWLKENGASENIINAIHSHGNVEWAENNGGNEIDGMNRFIPRKSLLDKVLFAVDEMSGLIVAVSLMRPNKLMDLEPKSVIKKIKDKGFAKGVNREDLTNSITELGIDMDSHISLMIMALRAISDRLFTE